MDVENGEKGEPAKHEDQSFGPNRAIHHKICNQRQHHQSPEHAECAETHRLVHHRLRSVQPRSRALGPFKSEHVDHKENERCQALIKNDRNSATEQQNRHNDIPPQ